MIGIGNALGGSVELFLFLSLFSLIGIPTISILGLKKLNFISKNNGLKKILILTLLYLSILLFGHIIMFELIQFGFYYCLTWVILLLVISILFSVMMSKKTKHNNV
tara:strand:- start:201 stop:518 length:318 start_codon:yes stop_codon:yes gene_type:complete